ncbi:hypothetical protein [Evansella halocellulosilytica]|uniref:hypothetical protein n=1 Tax=Evansella halocellulosilytica TaxID=2011013 RepID=UPI000BB73523|nr:hypothetical protein [Evansella halocellulosilytica]
MKGNAIVIIIPTIVMIGLFIFGYFIIQQTETVSNHDLDENIQIDMTAVANENEIEADLNWRWNDLPSDGLKGEGIIELAVVDEQLEPIDTSWEQAELQLLQGSEVIDEETNFVHTEHGIAFIFTNERIDQEMYGPQGQVRALFDSSNEMDQLEVRYYHHWGDEPFKLEENDDVSAKIEEEQSPDVWTIRRSVHIE